MREKHKICFISLFSIELLVHIKSLHMIKHIVEPQYLEYQEQLENYEIKWKLVQFKLI